MFRFLEFLEVRERALCARARTGKRSRVIDCSLAHQVTSCALLTSLVGLDSVTTLQTLMVCKRARTCVCARGRDSNLNACVGVAHAVALVDIAARSGVSPNSRLV